VLFTLKLKISFLGSIAGICLGIFISIILIVAGLFLWKNRQTKPRYTIILFIYLHIM